MRKRQGAGGRFNIFYNVFTLSLCAKQRVFGKGVDIHLLCFTRDRYNY